MEKSKVIHLEEANTLSNFLTSEERHTLVSLKITGFIGRKDFDDEQDRERGFRSLAGCWANDSGDDDMEAIIRNGRENRHGSRQISSFDE